MSETDATEILRRLKESKAQLDTAIERLEGNTAKLDKYLKQQFVLTKTPLIQMKVTIESLHSLLSRSGIS